MGAFADQLSAWGKQTEARMEAIYRRSVKLLADEMATTKPQGGRVPFESGNLARSLVASTQGMPKTSTAPTAGATVGVVIATLKLEQPVWLGYQAIYARRQNYGFVGADKLGRVFNQQGAHFVEYAIEMWPIIVKLAAEDTQARAEGKIK
ncbi:hypothetical protein QRD40_10860 [Comamonas sp. Y6]|uniref:HK97 gp10 family phage protein n=1 Tax=Comamonas resistens TaxID=3046670 RepID=A0ABY8SX10_9BURK|nr:hypothetical protein [Comamonas resistens]MDL5036846.1 hypothetical protein [Comamonas resistens]WHS67156.1 hypothetical protein QMY55_08575 [Comamonas resistens]